MKKVFWKTVTFITVIWFCMIMAGFCKTDIKNESSDAEPTIEKGQIQAEDQEDDFDESSEIAQLTEKAVFFDDWFETEILDDFGDSTGKYIFGTVSKGTFKNTATQDGSLLALIQYDPKIPAFSFRMLEYGDMPATYYDSSNLSIKYKSGKMIYESSLTGNVPNGDLILTDSDCEKLSACMLSEDTLKVIITVDSSEYSFGISCNGFDKIEAESARILEEIGIAGIYYNEFGQQNYNLWSQIGAEPYYHWEYIEIKPQSSAEGTIERCDKHGQTDVFDYIYDKDTGILTIDIPNSDDVYVVEGDTLYRIGEEYGGFVPDKEQFDVTVTSPTRSFKFSSDGTYKLYNSSDTNGWPKSQGVYLRTGDIMLMLYSDSFGEPLVLSQYAIHDNTFFWGDVFTR